MNEELMKQIVSLIQQGGNMALVIYIIHVSVGLFKYIFAFGALALAFRAAGRVVSDVFDKRLAFEREKEEEKK